MKLSRRDFVHAGCGIALALFSHPANAWVHGAVVPPVTNNNRVTINAIASYLNLAKGFGFAPIPGNQDANGYPVTTPASVISSNPTMPAGYYGTFTWSWQGTASMQILSAPPIVVASGGTAIFEIGTNSGDKGPSNLTLSSQANPSIVFAFGWNIQSISAGAGGVITINTKTNYVASGSGYTVTGSLVNITGANANTGANGTWTITNKTASSFDLVGSTFTNAQAGAAGQAIFAAGNMSIRISNSGTFSGFTNLIWCRSADLASINAGLYIDNTLISQLQYLMNNGVDFGSRGWLRFMDLAGVQANYEVDFAQRRPATAMSYGNWTPAGYWVGTITNTADALTCSNPSASGAGAYVDGEIVMGYPSATNSTINPTLNVNSRGAKPIFRYNVGVPPIWIILSGPPTTPGTDVMQFTFSATWLNGGTPYVVNYQTVAGDTTIGNLAAHLDTFFGADATLAAAKIFHGNPQGSTGPIIYPPTAQAGRLTVTYTSGPAIATIGTMATSTLATNSGTPTFIYNYLLDGWIYKSDGIAFSTPYEVIIEMCNRVGAHCWWCWGTTRGSFITAVTQFFADPTNGLTSGLRFGNEYANEVWNNFAFPYPILSTLGTTLGWSPSSSNALYSYVGLRTKQYVTIAKAAWTGAGRSASDYYALQMAAIFDVSQNSNFDTYQLKGTSLVTSNTLYANYGALNGTGTATGNYNAAGSRPVDITTAIGCAPYWNSLWLGRNSATNSSQINGTVAQNVPWLQASKDYALGSTATAFTSMVNQFNGTTTSPVPPSVGTTLFNYATTFTNEETQASQYDSYRSGAGLSPLAIMDYEGGPAFGVGADSNSGVNSVNSADIASLAARMTTLSWDVSAYTVSGTNDTTEMATMYFTMSQAWKYDATYKNLIKTSYYQSKSIISGSHRETKPAQYGYSQSNWGLFPASFLAGNQYSSYDAIHEWNA